MKEFRAFYKWYAKCFGIIPDNVDFDLIQQRLMIVDLKHSSFKTRANEVKQNFNYKFN